MNTIIFSSSKQERHPSALDTSMIMTLLEKLILAQYHMSVARSDLI